MKKNKKKKLVLKDKMLTILIFIFVIVTIILILLGLNSKNKLDTEDKLVVNLNNLFNIEDLNNCNGLFNYTEDKVEYSDINNGIKLCIAYHKSNIKEFDTKTIKPEKGKDICKLDNMTFRVDEKTNECTYYKVAKSTIEKTYKNIFGKNIEDTKEFNIDNLNICYLKDDNYYCGLSETFTYTIGSESTIYRVIKKAVEKGDNIIIYDYFLKIRDNKCYSNYTTTKELSKCSDKYDGKNMNYKLMKKYGTLYKHTYKKDSNNNYYWISSEPTK